MLPDRLYERVDRFATGTPHALFMTLINPKYRGPAFTWDKFVEMSVRASREFWVTVGCSPAMEKRYRAEIDELLTSVSRTTAERILQESGVREWLPLPPPEKVTP